MKMPTAGIQINIDRSGDCATSIVGQDDEQFKRRGKAMDSVAQTSQALVAGDVAGDAHYEKLIAALVENHLGGDARIGAAEDGSKRACAGTSPAAKPQPKA